MLIITITHDDGREIEFARDSEYLEAAVHGKTFQWSVFDTTPQAFNHLLDKGAQRSVNDYANSKGKDSPTEEKQKIAAERVACFKDASWSPGARGESDDPVMNWVRNILRDKVLADKTSDKAKAYKALKGDSEGRAAMLDSIYAAQTQETRDAVYSQALAARERFMALKAANAKQTQGIEIEI
jgi:hypothetical protein